MEKQDKITIEKKQARYLLTDNKGHTISVIIYGDGRISIYRQSYFNGPFEFNQSEKETVEAIAKLMVRAVKIK